MREDPPPTLTKVTRIAAISGRRSVREDEDRGNDVVVMGRIKGAGGQCG
jgi:hypothetical protein